MNYLPTTKHTDQRRTLIEWVTDYPIRACKVVVVHADMDIGDHFHKEKDEIFHLLSGSGTVVLNGVEEVFKGGDTILIEPNVKHTFKLKVGSILLGACTQPFNPHDDYKN